MADIKTHLRELSFATQIGILIQNLEIDLVGISSKEFFAIAKSIIKNDISNAENILNIDFNDELIQIIKNGVQLAKNIFNKNEFNFKQDDRVLWIGGDSQKDDPIDVKVGNYGFSLKEESFILENMGLYKYLNLLTNSNFKKGTHIFTNFASDAYEEWFSYTWNLLYSYISENSEFRVENSQYISRIFKQDNLINFEYIKNNSSPITSYNLPIKFNNWKCFMDNTTAKTREKVFGKWINEIASKDKEYIRLKSICSHQAGERIVSYIKNNINPVGIARLLQIYENEYYYAKVTGKEMYLFKIPSLINYSNDIEIDNINYDVPTSQLNILTRIKNKSNGNILIFRNECRFSHGQFNGTPEAKMYYDKGSNLSDIYIPIE